jgi:hypothetical protein
MTKALKGAGEDPSFADVMTRIAATLRKKESTSLVIKTLKRALVTEKSFGDPHPSVSTTAMLSLHYMSVGDFTKASAILEEVVKLKAATGVNSKEVAASLPNWPHATNAPNNSKAGRRI